MCPTCHICIFKRLVILMRVDKWIWAVRMVKSRSLGTEACRAGHVLVNGEKVKASHSLKIADIVEFNRRSFIKRYKVLGFIEKCSHEFENNGKGYILFLASFFLLRPEEWPVPV